MEVVLLPSCYAEYTQRVCAWSHSSVSRQRPTRSVRAYELAADLAGRLANDALTALAGVRIVPAPLKGVMLLARWPELRGHRDLADIDLLVSPDDFLSAEESLRMIGFEPTSRTNRGATFVRDNWPLSIDLHHRLFGPRLFDMQTSALLGRAELDDTLFAAPVMRLDDMDLFAHVVGHAVKSRRCASEAVVFDDIAWLLGALAVDAEQYAAHIRASQMHRAAGYVLGAAASRGELLAQKIVQSLDLDAHDRAAIKAASACPSAYWTPHLLNGRVALGARSFSAQVREDLGWRVRKWLSRSEPA